MKTIKTIFFIFILFSVSLFGQDNLGVDSTVYPSRYFPTNVTDTFAERLLELLTEYEKECYADSTLEQLPYKCYFEGCLTIHPPVDTWVHRKPTFEGFIEYLGRR